MSGRSLPIEERRTRLGGEYIVHDQCVIGGETETSERLLELEYIRARQLCSEGHCRDRSAGCDGAGVVERLDDLGRPRDEHDVARFDDAVDFDAQVLLPALNHCRGLRGEFSVDDDLVVGVITQGDERSFQLKYVGSDEVRLSVRHGLVRKLVSVGSGLDLVEVDEGLSSSIDGIFGGGDSIEIGLLCRCDRLIRSRDLVGAATVLLKLVEVVNRIEERIARRVALRLGESLFSVGDCFDESQTGL